MKKLNKKSKIISALAALILIIAIVTVFVPFTDSAKLRGEWTANAEVTDTLLTEARASFYEIEDCLTAEDLFVTVDLSLNRDGTYALELTISDASLEKLNTAIEKAAGQYVEGYYTEAAQMLGLDLNGLRDMYSAQGMDLDGEMDGAIAEIIANCDAASTVEDILSAYESEGTWEAEDGVITLTDGEGGVKSFGYSELTGSGFAASAISDYASVFPLNFSRK